jgi:hypothetical protein
LSAEDAAATLLPKLRCMVYRCKQRCALTGTLFGSLLGFTIGQALAGTHKSKRQDDSCSCLRVSCSRGDACSSLCCICSTHDCVRSAHAVSCQSAFRYAAVLVAVLRHTHLAFKSLLLRQSIWH